MLSASFNGADRFPNAGHRGAAKTPASARFVNTRPTDFQRSWELQLHKPNAVVFAHPAFVLKTMNTFVPMGNSPLGSWHLLIRKAVMPGWRRKPPHSVTSKQPKAYAVRADPQRPHPAAPAFFPYTKHALPENSAVKG